MNQNLSHLDQSTNDTQTGEAEVFERSGFAGRVQKRIEKHGNVSYNSIKYNVSNMQCILFETSFVSSYPAKRDPGFQGAKRHIASAPKHCKLDSIDAPEIIFLSKKHRKLPKNNY